MHGCKMHLIHSKVFRIWKACIFKGSFQIYPVSVGNHIITEFRCGPVGDLGNLLLSKEKLVLLGLFQNKLLGREKQETQWCVCSGSDIQDQSRRSVKYVVCGCPTVC